MTIDEIKKQIFIDSEDVCGNIMIDTYQAQDYVGMAYNKAIDDFIRKCEMESRVILDEIIHLSYYGLSMKELQRIAEQLKKEVEE